MPFLLGISSNAKLTQLSPTIRFYSTPTPKSEKSTLFFGPSYAGPSLVNESHQNTLPNSKLQMLINDRCFIIHLILTPRDMFALQPRTIVECPVAAKTRHTCSSASTFAPGATTCSAGAALLDLPFFLNDLQVIPQLLVATGEK